MLRLIKILDMLFKTSEKLNESKTKNTFVRTQQEIKKQKYRDKHPTKSNFETMMEGLRF